MIPLFKVRMAPDAHEHVGKVLHSGMIAQGPMVDQFETELSRLLMSPRDILTLNSATSALDLALQLTHVEPGDEVITTAMTCLSYYTPVLLADGRTAAIGPIVNGKKRVQVMAFSTLTNQLEAKPVVGWVKKPSRGVTWYRLRCEYGPGSRGVGGRRGVWITGDHRVLTQRGYVRVDALDADHLILTGECGPNPEQQEVINGVMLGDGHLARQRKGHVRFRVNHSQAQREWMQLTQRALQGVPHSLRKVPARGASKPSLALESGSGIFWRRLHERWYDSRGNKIVPHDLRMTWRTFAAWFMDDGHYERGSTSFVLCTEGFDLNSVWRLFYQVVNLGLQPRLFRRGRGWRIRIGGADLVEVTRQIGPFIPPAMRYKLPRKAPRYDKCRWDLGKAQPTFDRVIRERRDPPTHEDNGYVYCIEVEDHHNFIVADMVVQNCIATNVGIVHRGAIPVWADVDPFTGCINPKDVDQMITPRTAAIIAVDWAGVPCDYKALKAFGLPVIEDAAHALLAHHNGRPLPHSGGDYICWSFQAIKHLTTGDGGGLLVPADQLDRARRLRWYGLDRRSPVDFRAGQDIPELGYKYHLNDIAAAIGLANLPGAQDAVDAHRAHAATYYKNLNDLDPQVQLAPWVDGASYWVYSILVSDRPSFEAFMKTRGIQVSAVHARNDQVTSLCAFASPRPLTGLDYFGAHQVAIPCGWWLEPLDVERIIDAVRSWARR